MSVLFIAIKNKELKEEIRERTLIMSAQAELLHTFYASDHIYWDNKIIPSKEYKQLDSLLEGYWEDFYLY